MTNTIYPDSSDTTNSGTDQVKVAYHLNGSINTRTDQRGVILTYTYNDRRQVIPEGATTLPAGVDGTGTVRKELDYPSKIVFGRSPRRFLSIGRFMN